MSHLHIPDGILPLVLWAPGLALALGVLFATSYASPGSGRLHLAFQSALGGIMLALMALPVPITAFDYCMTLAGPVGVLLGPAAGYQVSFVVTLMLALLGQGGFTVVGLNAFVLGLGAMVARPLYGRSVAALGPARAMALATALSQLLSSACWVGLLLLSVRLTPEVAGEHAIAESLLRAWQRAGAAVVLPLLLLAVAVESFLGYGLARFLARVRPDLLPAPARARAGVSAGTPSGPGPAHPASTP
jgi:cobalt/nickel transport system permease protein